MKPAFMVQAFSNVDGWQDWKDGAADTLAQAQAAERALLATAPAWLPGKRATRIVNTACAALMARIEATQAGYIEPRDIDTMTAQDNPQLFTFRAGRIYRRFAP